MRAKTLSREQESDEQVTRDDQNNINNFGYLNNRLIELRADLKKKKVKKAIGT